MSRLEGDQAMKQQHTPAPWSDGLHHQGHLAIQSNNGRLVALCGALARDDEQLENLANARLISAAPDLLIALEACLHRLDEHDDQSAPECLMARAAIAKATGEQVWIEEV